MCHECDYGALLQSVGLSGTPRRALVLETIGSHEGVLRPREILERVRRRTSMNRVTLYRILDLLVENNLVRRLSASDRTFRYGLAGNSRHPDHAHFHCLRCGLMECLDPVSVPLEVRRPRQLGASEIRRMEIRFDGLCETCRSQKDS